MKLDKIPLIAVITLEVIILGLVIYAKVICGC